MFIEVDDIYILKAYIDKGEVKAILLVGYDINGLVLIISSFLPIYFSRWPRDHFVQLSLITLDNIYV